MNIFGVTLGVILIGLLVTVAVDILETIWNGRK